MKKQISVIFIALFFLLTSCTATITKRGMLTDNIYYSTHDPNIQIEISPDFSYHKGKTGKIKHQFKNYADRK